MKLPRQFDKAVGEVRVRALRLQRQFDERLARERLMIIAGVLAIVAWAADPLCITPAFKHWNEQRQLAKATQQSVVQTRQDQADRLAQARALEHQLTQDLATWRRRVQESDQNVHQIGGDLLAAGDMVSVLRGVLDQTGGLRLRSLQSVARTEIGAAAAGAPASAASGAAAVPDAGHLYRQGVDLEVEGSYEALLAYCQALEALPQHVLWGGMHLKADHHPRLVLTLRLYTLSPDRDWLVI